MSAVAAMNNEKRGDKPRRQRDGAGIGLRDRSLEFRKALSHSKRVKTLKALLPAMALLIFALYFVPSLIKIGLGHGKVKATVKAVTIDAGALKMFNPRVQGVNDKQGVYDMIADTATQQSRDSDTMYLVTVRGKLISAEGRITTLTAPDGLYNNKLDEMTFNNGALVKREPAMTAIFETAKAYMKQNLVISKTPVVVHMHESTINAQTMTLYSSEQRAVFAGKVHTHIQRQSATPEAVQTIPPLDTAPSRAAPSRSGVVQR